MIEKTFKHASASEAGDYYQVSFDDGDDYEAKDIGGRYFLIQRQFEFPDDGTYYLESDDSRFCGHFKIRAATLNTEFLSIELLADKWTALRIHHAAGQDDYKELVRIVRIMFEDEVLHLDQPNRKLRGPT
ncbi:MAG: hypothetical protein AABN33_12085 [Acidobacteriota bacterium]